MKSHTRVVVIGGGVVGCSVLYHLTRLGWSDVMLLERSELTAGSTWHAAGGMHTLNGDPNVAALQDYTIKLYEQIERESGLSCGIHRTGSLYLAVSDRELEFFKSERGKARHLGLDLDFIDLTDVKRLNPLIDTTDYRAAMFDPNDGHVDPSGVTNAYAQAARNSGAEIHRQTAVTAMRRLPNGEWEIETSRGLIRAEYVVNAAGLWAREVGRMMGVRLPIVPMEHQYLLTNDIPELVGLGRETPLVVDFDSGAYMRQERCGILLGTYEQDCRHWAVNGTPPDFGIELLPSDLERIAEPLGVVMQRVPVLAQAGVRRVVNGGMVFAPDGNPVIGPLPGQPTAFVAAGVMAGFSQGGGIGLAVAHWLVEGEPGMDVFAMDVARFGDFATTNYVLDKTRENYQRRFIISCPNEELPAARPLRVAPIYDRLRDAGALFGAAAGWEVPLWFADTAAEAFEPPSLRRTQAFAHVGAECVAVREAAGLWDTSSYCKIEVSGALACQWLDTVLANRVPTAVGRVALCPMLTPRGRILGDVTVARLDEHRFLLMGSPHAENVYLRWLTSKAPAIGVQISSKTASLSGLALTGPQAREILSRACASDVSNDAFPFLSARELHVGNATVTALRVSFTGELGYELYMAPEYQRHVFQTLWGAGGSLGLRNFGARALNSLRLEKGYGAWGREFTQDYTPIEAGMKRLVRTDKDYIGRDAFALQLENMPSKSLRILTIDSTDPDPVGGEPVFRGDVPVARLTSAGYGYTIGRSIGLVYLPAGIDEQTQDLEVELLGARLRARVHDAAPYDPTGERLRA